MKKYLLSSFFFFLVISVVGQEKSIVQVNVKGIDMQVAGAFYYAQFTKNLDALILEKKVHVYKDEALKEPIDLETFKKETLLSAMWQIINPDNPDDPYDLIDTLILTNQAMVTAVSLTWKNQYIAVSTKNINGPITYYLSTKEVDKADTRRGKTLLRRFSENYGPVNEANINQFGDAFLRSLCSPLFSPPKQIYSNPAMSRKMEAQDLKNERSYPRQNGEIQTYSYFPATKDAVTGYIIAFETDTEEDEIELEYLSIAPTYQLGTNFNPWYWTSIKSAKPLFTADDWVCLELIQSYTLRKRINPYFQSYTE